MQNLSHLASSRPKVLHLYKDIMKTGKNWQNPAERQDIIEEARYLFKKNKDLKDKDTIDAKIFEAESRLELALHYKIPYPRLTNVAPNTYKDEVKSKLQMPAYMDSYKDDMYR